MGHGAQGVALDHQAPGLAATLREWGVGLVIHTAGPFQAQAYNVAQAAAEAGAHYIDLADGRRFVCDFPAAMQAAFTAAGRTAIAGASTVPALSSAVIDHLCAGWQRIDSIDICIAPAQRAPWASFTLAAVLSYCGLPIDVWDGGRWQPHSGAGRGPAPSSSSGCALAWGQSATSRTWRSFPPTIGPATASSSARPWRLAWRKEPSPPWQRCAAGACCPTPKSWPG